MGTHYTPALLADFLAERVQAALGDSATQALRILDPACGDGRLLDAFLSTAGKAGRSVGAVVGVDADQSALAAASERLGELLPPPQLIHGDFLDLRTPVAGQRELWEPRAPRAEFDLGFDVVIANPPYVRTQVLGSERSVELARRFLLSGRVDLYQAFVVAATDVLRVGGLAGIILSNRFLITRGCSAFRRYLDQNYEIEEVIDLGDTKLFEAAVLPSIFIGRRRTTSGPAQARRIGRFTKVYSQPNGAGPGLNTAPSLPSVYAMLRLEQSGVYRVPEGSFAVTMGPLILDADAGQEWRLTTTDESRWLRRVQASAAGLFGEIAEVRVGIKTTADEVFIRSDWEALPEGTRPEPALLRPLLRHDDARRWSLPRDSAPTARILYPHEVVDGRRSVVDLVR
jgi:methylase of polypeptide subunit release factors